MKELSNQIREELERLKTSRGGYDYSTLRRIGVSIPPIKGWRKALLNGDYNTLRRLQKIPAPGKVRNLVPIAEYLAKHTDDTGHGSRTITCTSVECTYPACLCGR